MVVRELEPWREDDATWRRLEARFPAGLDTHCPVQVFYYDRDSRLRRHDYAPEVIGGWARAAHLCADHVEAGGLLFPTSRQGGAEGSRQPSASLSLRWCPCTSRRSKSRFRD